MGKLKDAVRIEVSEDLQKDIVATYQTWLMTFNSLHAIPEGKIGAFDRIRKELSRAYRGGHLTETDYKDIENIITKAEKKPEYLFGKWQPVNALIVDLYFLLREAYTEAFQKGDMIQEIQLYRWLTEFLREKGILKPSGPYNTNDVKRIVSEVVKISTKKIPSIKEEIPPMGPTFFEALIKK